MRKIVLREILEFLTSLVFMVVPTNRFLSLQTSGSESVREDMVKLIGLLSIIDMLEKHSDISIRATAARLLANFCFNGKWCLF